MLGKIYSECRPQRRATPEISRVTSNSSENGHRCPSCATQRLLLGQKRLERHRLSGNEIHGFFEAQSAGILEKQYSVRIFTTWFCFPPSSCLAGGPF